MTDKVKNLFEKEKRTLKNEIETILSSDVTLIRRPAFDRGLTALGVLRGYSEAFYAGDIITFEEQIAEDHDRIYLLLELYDAYYKPKVGDED